LVGFVFQGQSLERNGARVGRIASLPRFAISRSMARPAAAPKELDVHQEVVTGKNHHRLVQREDRALCNGAHARRLLIVEDQVHEFRDSGPVGLGHISHCFSGFEVHRSQLTT
jgi:hypothetical protein